MLPNSILSPLVKMNLSFLYHSQNLNLKKFTQTQQANFLKLKKKLKHTKIYRDSKIEYISDYENFAKHVPVKNYDDYAPYVDMLIAGHKNILFKDSIKHFGLSSGTSGKDSKKVPYNESMIKAFLDAQKLLAARLSIQEPQIDLLTAERLTFGSDPFVYTKNGHKFGYISGILNTYIPARFTKNTYPSREILAISNWDKKIEQIIEQVLDKDIQIVSGIPTYIMTIFEAILKKTGKTHINEIWPNLKVFIYSATPIKLYQERIDSMIGHPLNYYGLYASTEAPIGIAYNKFADGEQRYILNPSLLYTFSPIDTPDITLAANEIEMDTPYYLNLGTPNGFLHYAIKDVIQLKEIDGVLTFTFVGRQNVGISLAAEKVTELEVATSFLGAQKELNNSFEHYFLAPTQINGKDAYHWTIFSNLPENICSKKLSESLDVQVRQANGDYNHARNVGVLGNTEVTILSADKLKNLFAENRHRGQFKLKTIFNSSEEYRTFMTEKMGLSF